MYKNAQHQQQRSRESSSSQIYMFGHPWWGHCVLLVNQPCQPRLDWYIRAANPMVHSVQLEPAD